MLFNFKKMGRKTKINLLEGLALGAGAISTIYREGRAKNKDGKY